MYDAHLPAELASSWQMQSQEKTSMEEQLNLVVGHACGMSGWETWNSWPWFYYNRMLICFLYWLWNTLNSWVPSSHRLSDWLLYFWLFHEDQESCSSDRLTCMFPLSSLNLKNSYIDHTNRLSRILLRQMSSFEDRILKMNHDWMTIRSDRDPDQTIVREDEFLRG